MGPVGLSSTCQRVVSACWERHHGLGQEIADAFRSFRTAGFTQLEFMLEPQSPTALEAMASVLPLLDAD